MTEQQPIATAPSADVPPVSPADVPPMPEAPPVVAVEPPVKKDRRVLRAVLRWTAAVVVLAAVGSSTAYAITRMERTDVPGLATEADGRWTYPEITKPPLPSGSPAPFAEANPASVHYADLRALLLPAPKGAKADKALAGRDGWLAKKDFLSVYGSKEDRDDLGQVLTDHGLRHVAARGWTAQDGTRTRIYLLQFDSGQVADVLQQDHLTSYDSPNHALRGAAEEGAVERRRDQARQDAGTGTPVERTGAIRRDADEKRGEGREDQDRLKPLAEQDQGGVDGKGHAKACD